ncbi:conserved hypothetical protein [[Clostridium] ultunense Esp]|nr:conserved hypothetical protein [[Clostridium] ultunense Esp]
MITLKSKELQLPKLSVDLVVAASRSNGVLSKIDERTLYQIEERYRKFLFLKQLYPKKRFSPAFDIDEMWHLHMLHPRQYYNDCIKLFGDILDHNGGFGKKEEELPLLLEYFNETKQLWEKEFREEYITQTSRDLKKLANMNAEVELNPMDAIECAICIN